MPDRQGLSDFNSRRFGHFRSESLRQPGEVVGEDCRFAAGARDGDVAKP